MSVEKKKERVIYVIYSDNENDSNASTSNNQHTDTKTLN